MPGVSDPSLASASFSPSQLRHLLEQTLPSDGELDAFCIDYIPAVHRQFSAGMERTRKLNLLLLNIPPEELHEYLRRHKGLVAGRERTQPTPSFPGTNTTRQWGNLTVGFGCVAAGALAIVVFASGPHGPHNRSGSSESAASGHALIAPANADSSVAGALLWLTSEPSSALVFAVPSGRPLGQTPWAPVLAIPETPLLKGSLQVCLRSPGFIPALVKLEPAADPFRPRSIHVRLQREPRAGTQRDLGQETCNVPTPIIE